MSCPMHCRTCSTDGRMCLDCVEIGRRIGAKDGRAEAIAEVVARVRRSAATTIQNVRPADTREAEDCNLLITALNELADELEQAAHLAAKGGKT